MHHDVIHSLLCSFISMDLLKENSSSDEVDDEAAPTTHVASGGDTAVTKQSHPEDDRVLHVKQALVSSKQRNCFSRYYGSKKRQL